MGILSWLFPSEADRVREARSLMERGRHEEARGRLGGCESAEAEAKAIDRAEKLSVTVDEALYEDAADEADDYARDFARRPPRYALADEESFIYRGLSPRALVAALRSDPDTESIVIDPCPRCEELPAWSVRATVTAAQIIERWAVVKSSEMARADHVFRVASAATKDGRLDVARRLALAAVAHITPSELRFHELLSRVAQSLEDTSLEHDADRCLAAAASNLAGLPWN